MRLTGTLSNHGAAVGVKMIPGEPQLAQFALQGAEVDAEIQQRAQEHVAAEATKNVEI